MSPQLTVQQLEHAISNIEKRVEAKKIEARSFEVFRDNILYVLGIFTKGLGQGPAMDETLTHLEHLQAAAELFCSAKHATALIDLEELELNLKAYKHARSGIVGANMVIDPFKPNQRH
jgi:hypothetical protein